MAGEEAASVDASGRRPAAQVLITVLAVVGAIAIMLGCGLGLVTAGLAYLKADPPLHEAMSRFQSAAGRVPDVSHVEVTAGAGDLGTSPKDLYADVHLASSCTRAEVATGAEALRALIRHEGQYLLHPTIWCHSRGFTVAPGASTTAARLRVYDQLAADGSLRSAALLALQRGDDPSPDLDNAALTLRLYPRGPIGDAAERWRNRLAGDLPPLHLQATTSKPGEYYDQSTVTPVDRSVDIETADPTASALLHIANRLDATPAPGGYFIGGYLCSVSIAAPRAFWSHNADFTIAQLPAPCSLQYNPTRQP